MRLGGWDLGGQDCEYEQSFVFLSRLMAKAYDGFRIV